jgi:two-component system nitrogen regulation sensor histidine kinase NtrY
MHPSSRQAIDMNDNHDNARRLQLPLAERRRRRREGILIVVIIFAVALLTFLETRTIYFGGNIPVSNTILMFILININLLLLLLLLFLVFRNLVKLFYDRKRRIVGSKLRTRLVVAFIALTLMPAAVLFFFSINFITTSIRFWFNVPVEQTIEHSLLVGRSLYRHIEKENRHLLERTAYQIEKKELLPPAKRKALNRYIQIVQREFFQDGVEVYDVSAKRLTYAVSANLQDEDFERVPTEDLLRTGPEAKIHTISIQTAAGRTNPDHFRHSFRCHR